MFPSKAGAYPAIKSFITLSPRGQYKVSLMLTAPFTVVMLSVVLLSAVVLNVVLVTPQIPIYIYLLNNLNF